MDTTFIVTVLRQSLTVLLITVGPVLAISLIVGLLISILQAVTSIQEQTLTFVPKLIAIFLVIGLTGPWVATRIVEYFIQMMRLISTL